MFKTLFIIIISMMVSTLTTAGLLYRYTAPVKALPSQTVAKANPIESIVGFDDQQVSLPQVNSNDLPVVLVDGSTSQLPSANLQQGQVSLNESEIQAQRSFNHQLFVSDITSLSRKLERFNVFLLKEVHRLKGDDTPKKQP